MGHLLVLRSSAQKNQIRINFDAFVDPGLDPGLSGGRELIALGRAAAAVKPDPEATVAVAGAIGPDAAITAVEVAAAFAMTNRIVEATGIPAIVNQVERLGQLAQRLGIDRFSHSVVTRERRRPSKFRKALHRVRG